MVQVDLSLVLKARDQASSALNAIAGAMGKVINVGNQDVTLGDQLRDVGVKARSAASELVKLGAKLGVIGGIAAVGFKTAFVDVAAEFERMETALTTLTGSQAKAKDAMSWIKEFGSTTPYELGEVTEAFNKLYAAGLNPKDGTLKMLGDTAGGMGKPLMSAVEMLKDAVTGENERLKDFAIRTSTKGNLVAYSYFTKDGQEAVKVIRKNGSEIKAALSAIFTEKFGGGMEALSKTWLGMMSNIKDQWTLFVLDVMDAGPMNELKAGLKKVLAIVGEMQKSGRLKEIAATVGEVVKQKIIQIKALIKAVTPVILQILTIANNVAQALGGWGNVINIGLILMAMGAITSILSLVGSIIGVFVILAGILGTIGIFIGGVITLIVAITTGIAPIVAILGVVGGSVIMILQGLMGTISTIVNIALWVGRILLFAIRFAGPIGLAIAATVTLGLAIYKIVKHWDAIKRTISQVVELIKVGNLGSALKVTGSAVAKGIGFRANGGSVAKGEPYIVGERGAELMVPNGNGTVIPNSLLGNLGRSAKSMIPSSFFENLSGAGNSQTIGLNIRVDIENQRVTVTPTGGGKHAPKIKTDVGFIR